MVADICCMHFPRLFVVFASFLAHTWPACLPSCLRVMAEVEDSVKFADESPKPEKGQLLENVFADPRGFGIAADGRYRYELPGFTSGTAQVS